MVEEPKAPVDFLRGLASGLDEVGYTVEHMKIVLAERLKKKE